MNYKSIKEVPPPENVIVDTAIIEGGDIRNEQPLLKRGNLWWFPKKDAYVYYTPTHWRERKMKDDRTEAEQYADWVKTVNICHAKGWQCVPGCLWTFKTPNGTLHDLSAANLAHLDWIATKHLFLA